MPDITIDSDNRAPILSIIENIIFSDNLLVKMRASLVVINSLSEKVAEMTNAGAVKQQINRQFENHEFMRKLAMLSTIKANVETSLEYHGFDYINNPDFGYDEEMERKMLSIERMLADFHGKLLKELNSSQGIEL